MSRLEISIPDTSTGTTPSPHTLYHLTLRLPLRTLSLQKRYSDFVTFDAALTAQASGKPPPVALPPKSLLSSTLRNAGLTERRRQGLEAYLRAVNDAPDPRWRAAAAWRTFLNLPAGAASASPAAASLASQASPAPDAPITDPVAWLDAHRELKAHLHAARAAVAARDSATAAAAHEAAAAAKKELVRAGGLLVPLERGLRDSGPEWERNRLGGGEVRRRKDLLSAARREFAALEHLLSLVRRKADADAAAGELRAGDDALAEPDRSRAALLGPAKGVGKGRVLGKETARTRELDNTGVLKLQQQVMREQDADVDALAQVVRRQKELGLQIQQEIEEQNDLLDLLDQDVDRTEGKLRVARKRADGIS